MFCICIITSERLIIHKSFHLVIAVLKVNLIYLAMKFNILSIGTVNNSIKTRSHFASENVASDIIIIPRYIRALDGIECFSHIIVVFWLHKTKIYERSIMKVHPRKDPSLPLIGVFATRSPARPNPIGITTVKLVKKESNILTVVGLDAIDGSPVLDIKPYLPEAFAQSEVTLPKWIKNTQLSIT